MGQIDNAQQVLVGLGGQPHHEIKLYLAPAHGKGRVQGLPQVIFADTFVDDIAHPLSACFRRKGQARFFQLRELTSQVDAKGINSQTGQAHFRFALLSLGQKLSQKRANVGIITTGQTHKAALFPAGLVNQVDDGFEAVLQ